MKISCMYCGRIHEKKYDCGKKPKKTYGKRKEYDRFRWQQSWKDKREEIKERDNYLCQVCLEGLYPIKDSILTYEKLEVHHIEKIKDRPDLALDNSNLITLDEYHHEMAEKGIIPKEYLRELVAKKENISPPRVYGSCFLVFFPPTVPPLCAKYSQIRIFFRRKEGEQNADTIKASYSTGERKKIT